MSTMIVNNEKHVLTKGFPIGTLTNVQLFWWHHQHIHG